MPPYSFKFFKENLRRLSNLSKVSRKCWSQDSNSDGLSPKMAHLTLLLVKTTMFGHNLCTTQLKRSIVLMNYNLHDLIQQPKVQMHHRTSLT